MTLIFNQMEPSSGRGVFISDCLLTRSIAGEGEVIPAPMHYRKLEPLKGIEQARVQSKSILVGEHLLLQCAGSWDMAHKIHRKLSEAYAGNKMLTAGDYHHLIQTEYSVSDLTNTAYILTTLHNAICETAPFHCSNFDWGKHTVLMAGSGTDAITDNAGLYMNRSPGWNPTGGQRQPGAPIHEAMNHIGSMITFEMVNEHFLSLRTGFWYDLLRVTPNGFGRVPYSLSTWIFEGDKPSRITSKVQYLGDWGVVYRISPMMENVNFERWQFSTSMEAPAPTEIDDHELLRRPVEYSIHVVRVGKRFSKVLLEGETFSWRTENEQHFIEENSDHVSEIFQEAQTLAGM